MADLISIERKAGAGAYGEVYSGAWDGSPWTDEGPFADGVTYTYKARRVIDGAPSDYSGEDAVAYLAAYITIERKDGAAAYAHRYTGAWSGSPWTDTAENLSNGVTYKYRATRTVDGETSGYSNEETINYAIAGGGGHYMQPRRGIW